MLETVGRVLSLVSLRGQARIQSSLHICEMRKLTWSRRRERRLVNFKEATPVGDDCNTKSE